MVFYTDGFSRNAKFPRTERTEPNPYFPHFFIQLPTHFSYINVYIIDTGFFVCIFFLIDAIFHNLGSWKNKEKKPKHESVLYPLFPLKRLEPK